VGPPLDGHRAAGIRYPDDQGSGPARLAHRQIPASVRSVAQHDHRGVRDTSARGRATSPVPHDGDHTVVEPVQHGRPTQRRHGARLRHVHGRRAGCQNDSARSQRGRRSRHASVPKRIPK